MALIVGVHGIAQQLKEAAVLDAEWWPSLKGGIAAAKRSVPEGAFTSAFYGGLFRPRGQTRATGDREYLPTDVTDGFEAELLAAWWGAAAAAEPGRVVRPDAQVRLAVPKSVQAGLRALTRSKFFVGIAESALIGNLKQVRDYMKNELFRDAAQQAVNAVVSDETRVIVAHSLGSVVAFEALHRYASAPNWVNVRTLVTLGSPLGIANLIFSALKPAPEKGRGKWPPGLARWTNLSADNDVVALEKRLGPLFDSRIVDMRVENEARAHDVSPYLTASVTGAAIADGLSLDRMARRFVIGIGVATYDDAALNLAAVPKDVAMITDWFANGSPLRHERALSELSDSPSNEQIQAGLSTWLEARAPDDYVVVYLAAHGEVEGGTAYVQGRNSPRQRLSGRAIDGKTLGGIIGQSPPHNVLFIVDACVAGRLGSAIQRAAEDVSDTLNTRDPFRKWSQAVVCSTFGRDPAHDGSFAQAFLKVVTHEQWTGTVRPFMDFDRLMEGLNKELEILGVPQVAERKVWGPAPAELIPNPNYGMRQPSALIADEDLASHFDPAARGVTRGETGWYFIGRQHELTRIVRWLEKPAQRGGSNRFVITGSPGSGKSALISRVVMLSDPGLRESVRGMAELPPQTVPAVSSITVALWCHNKTLEQLVAELGARLGVNARTASTLVQGIAAIPARAAAITIAIDALDEAVEGHAQRIAAELIVPLAMLDDVKVLVATRPHPVYASSNTVQPTSLLDTLRVDVRDESSCLVVDQAENRTADMRAYVAARLMGTGEPGRSTPYSDKPDIAARVAELVTEAAKSSFLVAAVTARSLAGRLEVVTSADLASLPTAAQDALAGYIHRLPQAEVVIDVLRPLAWAEGAGLPWGLLWAPIANALARLVRPGADVRYDDAAIAQVLDRASDLVVESTESGQSVYRLFHAALAEHLRGDLAPARAHDAIAATIDAIVAPAPFENAPAYALAHLTSHLAQAPEKYARLYALATSPDWERAQRERFGHTTSSLRDVDLAIEGALARDPPDLASLTGACLVYARQMTVAPAPVIDIVAKSGQLQRAELMANNLTFALERCWAYAMLAPTLHAERDVAGAQRCLAEAERAIAALNPTHAAMAWAWIAQASELCEFRDRALAAAHHAAATIQSLTPEDQEWELSNVLFWAGKAARYASDDVGLATLRDQFTERVHSIRNQDLQAAAVLGATDALRAVWSKWMAGARAEVVRVGNLALALASARMTAELDALLHVIASEPRAIEADADARKRLAWALALSGRFEWAFQALAAIDDAEHRIAALGRIVDEGVRQRNEAALAEARRQVAHAEDTQDPRVKARLVTILYALDDKVRAVGVADELMRDGIEPSAATTVAFPRPDHAQPIAAPIARSDAATESGRRRKSGRRHLQTRISALADETLAAKVGSLADAGDFEQARAVLATIRVPQFRWRALYAIASAMPAGSAGLQAWEDALVEARLVNESSTRITAFALVASLSPGLADDSGVDRLLMSARAVTKAWTQAACAEQYEALRELLAAGGGRTQRMEALMATTVHELGTNALIDTIMAVVIALAAMVKKTEADPVFAQAQELLWGYRFPLSCLWTPADVAALVASGEAGKRVFALALMQSSSDLAALDPTVAMIEGSLSAFEQFHALKLALELAPRLEKTGRARLRSVIEQERKRYIAPGTDRFEVSELIVRGLSTRSRGSH